jgi:hypothetical protein
MEDDFLREGKATGILGSKWFCPLCHAQLPRRRAIAHLDLKHNIFISPASEERAKRRKRKASS